MLANNIMIEHRFLCLCGFRNSQSNMLTKPYYSCHSPEFLKTARVTLGVS